MVRCPRPVVLGRWPVNKPKSKHSLIVAEIPKLMKHGQEILATELAHRLSDRLHFTVRPDYLTSNLAGLPYFVDCETKTIIRK